MTATEESEEVELGFVSPEYGARLINRVGQLRTALDALLALVDQEVSESDLDEESRQLLRSAREVWAQGTEEESDRATILLQRDEAQDELARWIKRMKLLEARLDAVRTLVK